MKRIAALALCLAATWQLYALGAELFIGWYSGVEYEQDFGTLAWLSRVTPAVVNIAASLLAWRIVRAKLSRASA